MRYNILLLCGNLTIRYDLSTIMCTFGCRLGLDRILVYIHLFFLFLLWAFILILIILKKNNKYKFVANRRLPYRRDLSAAVYRCLSRPNSCKKRSCSWTRDTPCTGLYPNLRPSVLLVSGFRLFFFFCRQ